MKQIAIADDDRTVLHFLRSCFMKSTQFKCVFTTNTLDGLSNYYANDAAIDFLLLDVHFPNQLSIEHIPKLKQIRPETEIIVFSSDEEPKLLIKSLSMGASGYLPKSLKPSEILKYLEIATNGGAAITPELTRQLITHLQPTTAHASSSENQQLNFKDQKVLELLAEGKSYQMIASYMNVSINTVRYHIKKIYKCLQVNSKGEAIYYYNKNLRFNHVKSLI